ncbi:hypothetical protein QCA50_007038 [Cerrena zonata]|uniref:Uncharacterized protein n=1 Tax=Cerrena zonata TaxID=2478898 RepID=A0AAW0GGW0_9APHY
MLSPYPTRLRSSSNPPRPRPLAVDTNGVQTHPDAHHPYSPLPPSAPHSPVESAPNSPKIKVRTLAGLSLPSSRKIFRLKRPASSSSSLLPIQSPTASIIWEAQNPTPNASAIWESHITSPPPRPSRNPARPSSSQDTLLIPKSYITFTTNL